MDTLDYQRTIVVFQPHTYSRTAKLFNDFVEQLRRPTIVYLAEIYAAREKNTIGISSADLAAQIPGAKFYPTFAEIEAELRRIAARATLSWPWAPATCSASVSTSCTRRTIRTEPTRLKRNFIKSCRFAADSFLRPKANDSCAKTFSATAGNDSFHNNENL